MYKKSVKSQLLISWKLIKHYYNEKNLFLYKIHMKKYVFLSSLIMMLTLLTACWNNENTEENSNTSDNETLTIIDEETTTNKKIPDEEIYSTSINNALQELAAQALNCET